MEKKEYTTKDVAALLKEVERECLNANFRRREIARLKLECKRPNTSEVKKVRSLFQGEPISASNYDEEFESDISVYLEALGTLKEDFTLQDVIDVLPSKDDYNYLRINYRLQCEIIKNIKSIMIEGQTDSEFLEFLPEEKKKLQFLREAMALEDEEEISESVCNKIILVPSLSGNYPIIDDVEHLPYDVYDDVLELINSIIDGTFKRNKGFTHINELSGICEVRKGDLRVIYTRISKDTYAIITTFIKKIDTDQYYRDNLNRKANNYRSVEGILRANLDNSDFIRENDLQVQRLFSMLKRDEEDAKVLGKGGINE